MAVYISENKTFTIAIQGEPDGGGNHIAYALHKGAVSVKFPGGGATKLLLVMWNVGNVTKSLPYLYTYEGKGVAQGQQVCDFNIGDLVRSNVGGQFSFAIQSYDIDTMAFIDGFGVRVSVVDGIPYSEVIAPNKPELPWLSNKMNIVAPPNVMVMPNDFAAYGGLKPQMLFESNMHIGNKVEWRQIKGGMPYTITPYGLRENVLRVDFDAEAVEFRIVATDEVKRWNIERLQPCQQVALVQWQSQTGATRRHYFPIVGHGNEGVDRLELLSVANGYNVEKNVRKSLECRIDGLTPYGCWYYQDLLTASNVHAIVVKRGNVLNYEIDSEESAVEVVGGMADTPDGSGLRSFAFTLKIGQYDTH